MADENAESDPDPSINNNMVSSDETDETHNTEEETSGKYLITYFEENENYSNMLMYV